MPRSNLKFTTLPTRDEVETFHLTWLSRRFHLGAPSIISFGFVKHRSGEVR